MSKVRSQFICQQCGYSQVGWAGKCPNCNNWGSLVETIVASTKGNNQRQKDGKLPSKPINLSTIKSSAIKRISTKIPELDRSLGGGLVTGQVVLIAGEPGIGKSTILLQLADKLSNCLYVSGEESANQVAIRAKRLGIDNKNIKFLEETDVDSIIDTLDSLSINKPTVIIVDSIQTMSTSDLTGLAGSVGQVKECSYRLLKYAKANDIPLILVGHVTKEGTVAGPAVLAHIVDTVLWFEGEKTSNLRLLRSVKNRFGATDEVGIFSMEDKGLISMNDPEKLFLERGKTAVAGSVVSILMEGTRSLLVEIQSLVVPTKMAFPRRVAQGIDSRRLEMLLAVLFRRAGIPLYDSDVFVNVAGGIKAQDPSVDLAICLSIASSFFDKPLPKNFLAVGEVGLLGEIRGVSFQEKRIKDSRRLGFSDIVTSKDYKVLPQLIKNYLK
ncbi:DNA repair protein RadA [Candidatus Woesebacteria bacterium RIFOXYC1_FULL_31_51]|uniref:DNA repair protein RadA n=1 Tax=Candidatus Woesebacteria bacterium GW2011_GWC2_31_9 TaxID=1618586 RepID=A0A0F9YH24_9BACT|nr:MAG: repair protein RadA-like protein, DNA repair protein RadA/Sms [Candidatus Woesebacteria bacterium GW2011_GWF1_31_35]KKP23076.1 MAG: repair protein radA protein [Candidatus Woesebacteria bacterium GW2011_GWC1_30_29]KKP25111.1 MAG: repair protein radA protein [Candidatus Woesebacteria bacterium GW2011_GWD1_31_12]KKP27318.1 MAG: repair protein radA protein [Candidatus Woesebacteria bacterium GW2011_GWB1_31_29]KKP30889.1 MAG: repair protein radA protein [Candidatus Woesebacteria bacterium G